MSRLGVLEINKSRCKDKRERGRGSETSFHPQLLSYFQLLLLGHERDWYRSDQDEGKERLSLELCLESERH